MKLSKNQIDILKEVIKDKENKRTYISSKVTWYKTRLDELNEELDSLFAVIRENDKEKGE